MPVGWVPPGAGLLNLINMQGVELLGLRLQLFLLESASTWRSILRGTTRTPTQHCLSMWLGSCVGNQQSLGRHPRARDAGEAEEVTTLEVQSDVPVSSITLSAGGWSTAGSRSDWSLCWRPVPPPFLLVVPPRWKAGVCAAARRRDNRRRTFLNDANNTVTPCVEQTQFCSGPPSQSQASGPADPRA